MHTVHKLKIHPSYYEDVVSGKKTFEVRLNDRNYAIGDILRLREWLPKEGYTGRAKSVRVCYILRDFQGLKDGWVVLGITEIL